MNKRTWWLPIVLLGALATTPAVAGNPLHHSGQASTHSVQAVAASTLAGASVVSGIVALPLLVGGEVGAVSGRAGETLWQAAGGVAKPLPITDETYLSTPSPAEAMAE